MESDRRMDPALFKAAMHGKVSSLKQLVQRDPNVLSATTPQLNSALHLAALHGNADFAELVLENKEDLLVSRNDDGDTALHLAAKSGKLKVAELLIRHALAWPPEEKSPLIMVNRAGNSPLHEAVRHRRSAVAVALLYADPQRGHDLNERMESPLHMAAQEGLVNVVHQIINNSYSVEVEQEFLPSVSLTGTALHKAVLGGHIRIVEMLLDKRPQLIDLTDSDGNNALHYAAEMNNMRAVEMLLNRRTELAYKRNKKNLSSPLHVAAHYGSTDAMKALLRHCPDVTEMIDRDGRNAFHASVYSGKLNALKCLLRHIHPTELLNRIDGAGNTPLHLAAKMSRVSSALMLLRDRRVDPCVRDHEGHTARSSVEQKLATGEVDEYEMYLWKHLKLHEAKRCRKQQLPPLATHPYRKPSNKNMGTALETYILVATVIATASFAATFTMPGGYDQSKGITLHGHNTAFKIFIIANAFAMFISVILIVCMTWAWQDPVKFKVDLLLWGQRLTVLALLAMLVSFVTAVYITVAPTERWPAYVVIAMGATSPIVVLLILGREVIYAPF